MKSVATHHSVNAREGVSVKSAAVIINSSHADAAEEEKPVKAVASKASSVKADDEAAVRSPHESAKMKDP